MSDNQMNPKERINLDALIYGVYAAIIPMNMIMNFSGAATVNKQLGMIAAAVMILFILFQRKMRYLKNPNWGFIVFALYTVLSSAWSISFSETISALTTLLSLVLIYLVGKMREFNSKEVWVVVVLMIAAAAMMPFFLGVNTAVSYSRGTLMNENGAADHNGLACNLAFCAILALNGYFISEKKVVKYAFAVATGLIVIAVFMTGSRGALAGLGIAIVYYLLKAFPELRSRHSVWGTVILVTVAVVALFYYLENNLSAAILRRLSLGTILYDRGSGRLDTWKNIFHILWDNPIRALVGWGYGTQKTVLANYYGVGHASHNAFLQMWIDVGLVGMIAFLVGMIKFWKEALQKRVNVVNALWIALFVTLMTLTFGTNKGAWNVFLLMYLYTINTRVYDTDEDF